MKKSIRTRLIEERKSRKWSQRMLADRIGTTQNNVSRWELGLATPRPYFSTKLCKLFDKSAQELELLPLQSTQDDDLSTEDALQEAVEDERVSNEVMPATSCLWSVPYRRNPWFTGRETTLEYLAHTFQQSSEPLALSSLGGIGKTQLALEYAYRFRNDYRSVFWVRAETRDNLQRDFQALANVLGLPHEEKDPQQTIQTVKYWLSNHLGWLLIFDNVEDLTVIRGFLPTGESGHILLTTRLQSLGTLAHCMDVAPLPLEEAASLLLRRAQRIAYHALLQEAPSPEITAALVIAKMFGGLPLALDQAGAYIEMRACSLDDYLEYFQQRRHYFLAERGQDDGTHPLSVATTFQLSVTRLECLHPTAAYILRLCAFLLPDAIPEELFTTNPPPADAILAALVHDPLAWEDVLANLRAYSLLQRNRETKTLSLHRLVQVVLQEQMDEAARCNRIEQIIFLVNRVFPENGRETTGEQYRRLLPQAQACAQLIVQWHICSLEAGQLLRKIGSYFMNCDYYTQAEAFFHKARAFLRPFVGDSHLEITHRESDLDLLGHPQDRYARSEEHRSIALIVQEQLFPLIRLDISVSTNFGHAYYQTGLASV